MTSKAVTPPQRRKVIRSSGFMVRAAMVACASLLAASTANGQVTVSCVLDAGSSRIWLPPLDRKISLAESTTSLRDALERVSGMAGVRLTWANDVVGIDRTVCASFEGLAVGDVLSAWLRGRAEPVAVGGSQVVLAPRSRPVPRVREAGRGGVELEPVIVVAPSGLAGDGERSATAARDIWERDRGGARGTRSLAELLDGVIPAGWLWASSPASPITFGAIRGASSFGISYPKVYIDGVELANPLVLGRLSPESLERIEVIRGPQGTALYGTDAIGGVINITTRSRADRDGHRFLVSSSAGHSGSAYSSLGALVQDHSLSASFGSTTRSLVSNISAASIGGYVPGAYSRRFSAQLGASVIGSRTRLQGTARLEGHNSRDGVDVVAPAAPWVSPGSVLDAPRSVRSYTVGAQVTRLHDARWTHSAVFGVDGYALDGGGAGEMARNRVDAGDSAIFAARGRADRATLRLSSAARLGEEGGRRSAVVTFGLDHSLLRDAASRAGTDEFLSGSAPVWRASFGATGQLAAELGRQMYLNAGVRLEHTTGFIAQDMAAALPSLGAAWVRDVGVLSFKLRAAYGRAIRSPREAGYRLASALSPEQQEGVEFGADVNLGTSFGLRVTRFDQEARDLVQPVLATISPAGPGPSAEPARQLFTLQNVGVISNRGWEFQANGARGPLSLSGSLGLIESRVVHVAAGYTGDLRAGDRMLQVPGLTASASATWSARSWSSTLGVARASDWVNYDWIRLTGEASDPAMPGSGAGLRSYWLNYPGVTRVRASFSRELTRGLMLLLSGDNLLGTQRGEPDNVTVLPGRTLTAGLRALFR